MTQHLRFSACMTLVAAIWCGTANPAAAQGGRDDDRQGPGPSQVLRVVVTASELIVQVDRLGGRVPDVWLADQELVVLSMDRSARTIRVARPANLTPGTYPLWVGGSKRPDRGIAVTFGGPGAAGPAGAAGPMGPQGAPGPRGETGPTGVAGDPGPAGPAGPAGTPGAAGAAGPAGSVGPQGPQGAPGVTGATGPAGPEGAPGPAGLMGPQGVQGAAGPVGPTGAAGAQGAQGPQGPQGDTGAAGPAGPVGADGAAGAAGPQGPVGAIGAQGPAGPAGPKGPTGNKGPTGDPGANIYIGGGGFFRAAPTTAAAPEIYAPSADTFAGSTTSAEVASVQLPAGTYQISAKVTALGLGVGCHVSLDSHGVLDQTRVQSPFETTAALSLQATVATTGGTLQFHCASVGSAPVVLENAKLHAVRVVK
jgi:Collagen triple helix repeat (20 copies)